MDRADRTDEIRNADESVFSKYSLYILQHDSNSQKALEFLQRFARLSSSTAVINVREPGVDVPNVVRGVPTLIERDTKLIHEGSKCLRFLFNWEPTEPIARIGKFVSKHSRQCNLDVHGQPMNPMLCGAADINLDPPTEGEFTETGDSAAVDVEDFVRRRKQMMDRIAQMHMGGRSLPLS